MANLYIFSVPSDEVNLYLVEHTPAPFTTLVKESLTLIEFTPSDGENIFEMCSETVLTFFYETDPTQAIPFPYNIDNAGNCGSPDPDPDPDPDPEVPIDPIILPQSSIYDLNCQRFILIKDSAVKIFPEDVIDINTFTDVYFMLDEPEGFDVAELLLERDTTSHGFNYEYTIESLKFGCNGYGKEYLENVFLTSGTDSDVKFIYGYGTLESFNVLYIGRLDFNEYGNENAEYVTMNLLKDDFGSILQSNFEITQSVEPDKDILLYSKAIPKKVEYLIPQPNQVEGTIKEYPKAWYDNANQLGLLSNETPPHYLFINDGKEGDGNLEILPTYDFQLDSTQPSSPSSFKFIIRAKESGSYTVDIKTLIKLKMVDQGITSAQIQPILTLEYFKTGSDGTVQVGAKTTLPAVVRDGNSAQFGFWELEFDYKFGISLELEQCFYLYIKVNTNLLPVLKWIDGFKVEALPFKGDINQPQITVVAETLAPASTAKFVTGIDLLEGVFKQAAEVDYTIVKSDFISTGCAKNLLFSNGFGVRGGTSLDEGRTSLKISPKKLFESYSNLFNLGWGVEYSVGGNELVRVESAEYFYQDAEIIELSLDDISDYSLSVDTSAYYNEIEVGFSKYSKERETDKGNTLDDFHTKHIYQTPIKTNKSKFSAITDFVLSGYEIEILRRKQFKKTGDNENANFKEDEDIFGVQIIDFDNYTGGEWINLLTEFSDGQVIRVSNNFVVVLGTAYFYNGQQVTVNIDGQGEQLTGIMSIQYGMFTPVGFPFAVFGTRINFSVPIDSSGTSPLPSFINLKITTVGGENYLVPESNQAFSIVENLLSPQTAYNLRYSPKRILLNWAKMFNGGFRGKLGTDTIKFKQGDGNVELLTKLGGLETCVLGDLNRDTLTEKGDLTLNSTFNREYLFLPYKVSFSCSMSFEELNYIRRAMRGMSADNNNYGYVSYVNPSGVVEQIYLSSIKFSPVNEEAKIEGYLKSY